jgi:TPR repeat protein
MLLSMESATVHSLPLPRPDATGDELFRLGLLYSTGQGGAPLDYVSAHMLFNLAAMRGSVEAKIYPAPSPRVARPRLTAADRNRATGPRPAHSPAASVERA